MPDPDPQARQFPSTCWSLVLAARDPAEPRARQALASLCSAYWYPLYAFIRRRGSPPELAEDLAQEFFAGFLRRGFLDGVAPDRGRFRAFLLAACKNFLANRRDHDRARKRGGGLSPVPIDCRDAEGRYAREPAHEMTPERLYDRRWALTLLDRVLGRLAAEMGRAGKGELFARLEPTLMGGRDAGTYALVAGELGLTEGAVKMAAHRLRRRYRELLRAEIGRTVADPAGVDQEIRDLFAALACRERRGFL